MKPKIGKTYLWDFGGRRPVKFTVRDIKTRHHPGQEHADGSSSPAIDTLWVSDGSAGYFQWIPRNFTPTSPSY